jgi:hypothetical protein
MRHVNFVKMQKKLKTAALANQKKADKALNTKVKKEKVKQ